jgi:NAD(P)-dependent dehydrogenase (short-subunit alcohol dehydrogenase family)
MDLDGAVVVVTGASRGIGAAICLALGEAGARVGVVARTDVVEDSGLPGSVSSTVAAVRDRGAEAVPVIADVGKDADRERLVAQVREQLGEIDALVNNAAFTVPGRPGRRPVVSPGARPAMPGPLDAPLTSVRLQLEVNLLAPLHLMQLVVPGMVERRRGAVLNISSDASRRPGEGPWPPDAEVPGRGPTEGARSRSSTSPAPSPRPSPMRTSRSTRCFPRDRCARRA